MKRKIFSLLVLSQLFVSMNIYSQVFAPVGASWTIHKYEGRYGQGSMPCDYAGTYTFEVTGEIIVDNKNVKVVTSSCNQDLLIWDDDPRIYFYENDSF